MRAVPTWRGAPSSRAPRGVRAPRRRWRVVASLRSSRRRSRPRMARSRRSRRRSPSLVLGWQLRAADRRPAARGRRARGSLLVRRVRRLHPGHPVPIARSAVVPRRPRGDRRGAPVGDRALRHDAVLGPHGPAPAPDARRARRCSRSARRSRSCCGRHRPASRSRWLLPVLHSHVVAAVGHPVVAWLTFTLVVWVSHFSPLFDLALEDRGVHDLEHVRTSGRRSCSGGRWSRPDPAPSPPAATRSGVAVPAAPAARELVPRDGDPVRGRAAVPALRDAGQPVRDRRARRPAARRRPDVARGRRGLHRRDPRGRRGWMRHEERDAPRGRAPRRAAARARSAREPTSSRGTEGGRERAGSPATGRRLQQRPVALRVDVAAADDRNDGARQTGEARLARAEPGRRRRERPGRLDDEPRLLGRSRRTAAAISASGHGHDVVEQPRQVGERPPADGL